MKTVSVFLGLIFFSIGCFAQDEGNEPKYYFDDKSADMFQVEVPEYFGKHWLGSDFRTAFYALKEKYVYKPEATNLNPQPSPVIEKPSIYNSIKKIDRSFKKAVKKGTISEEEARQTLYQVLKIGYSVRYENTAELEDMLWGIKDPVELTQIFTTEVALR